MARKCVLDGEGPLGSPALQRSLERLERVEGTSGDHDPDGAIPGSRALGKLLRGSPGEEDRFFNFLEKLAKEQIPKS